MFQGYIKYLLVFAVMQVLISTGVVAATNASTKVLYIEGKDYVRLPADVRNSPEVKQLLIKDSNKVQVLFFFSYGCHACELFHTPFEKWTADHSRANKTLAIYRYPVAFNPQWQVLARLYYTMETLDPKGKLNNAIFDAIHKRHIQLWQEQAMSDFFVQNGYKAKDFSEAYGSFTVNRQTKQADEISKAYKITETPDIIVNGPVSSYRVSIASAAGNTEKLFKIVDYLVQRETKLLNN